MRYHGESRLNQKLNSPWSWGTNQSWHASTEKKIKLPCKWGNIHHRFEPFRVPAFSNFCFFWARMLNSSKLSKFYRHIHMANDFEVIIDPENRNPLPISQELQDFWKLDPIDSVRKCRKWQEGILLSSPGNDPQIEARDALGHGFIAFVFFFWLVVWNMLYFPQYMR